ncbi:hypothetical protein [Candidatus Poriferisodalis sp.]|uniref:hypothetical protein n=1 Tax=Candidatus Poriferisodalis sp. TaxID=3101277 RepID=UPI003B01FC0A
MAAIAAKSHQICGLEADHSVRCWEWPTMRDFGTAQSFSMAGATLCGLNPDQSIACRNTASSSVEFPDGRYLGVMVSSTANACAFTEDSTLLCVGEQVPTPPAERFNQVSLSGNYACGVLATGEIRCRGDARDPAAANVPSGKFAEVSVGLFHTCALCDDGEVECWGWNRFGQSDPPNSGARSQMRRPAAPGRSARQPSARSRRST